MRCEGVHVADLAALDGKAPPHNVEAEIAVLGSMLLDGAAAARVVEIVRAGDFYLEPHDQVFRVMASCVRRGEPLDPVLVREELQRCGVLEKVGGTGFISRIVALVPTIANAEHYAKIVRNMRRWRDLAGAGALVQRTALAGDEVQLAAALDELERVRAEDVPDARLEAMTASALLAAELPPRDWIVSGLIVRPGVSLLVGDPKAGKSLAGLGLAVRVAEGFGGTWLGSEITPRVGGLPVLLLSAEGGPAMLQPRARVLAAATDVGTLDRLHIVAARPFPKLDTRRGLDAVRRLALDAGVGLVVVDPLVRFRNVANENDNAAAVLLAKDLRELAEDTGAAVLVLHHPGRAGQRDEAAASFRGGRGASAMEGEVDASISLRRMPKRGEVHAFYELRDAEPIEPGRRLVLNRETLWLDFVGIVGDGSGRSATGAAVRAVSDDVLVAALRTAGRALRGAEWATAAGLSERNLRRRVPALITAGQVETTPGPRTAVLFRLRPAPARTTRTTLPLSGLGSEENK